MLKMPGLHLRNAAGWTALSQPALLIPSGSSIRNQNNIRGGVIDLVPEPKTSAGVSTISASVRVAKIMLQTQPSLKMWWVPTTARYNWNIKIPDITGSIITNIFQNLSRAGWKGELIQRIKINPMVIYRIFKLRFVSPLQTT